MKQPPRSHRPKSKSNSKITILDQFSEQTIGQISQKTDLFLKFQWSYYSELAHQRSLIVDQLKESILETCIPYQFSHWQRVVRYKWALNPLSSKGSLSDPGGRFNIGDIDSAKFPTFSALYLAQNKETALKEMFGEDLDDPLVKPDSVSHIALLGKLEVVFDLTIPKNLANFVKLTKRFKIPNHLHVMARKLGLPSLHIIQSVHEMLQTLNDHYWRASPVQFDIPANSQIFGQIAYAAGVEGILYESRFTKKLCLAVFPKNFEDSTAFIEIEDEGPTELKLRRLDHQSYMQL